MRYLYIIIAIFSGLYFFAVFGLSRFLIPFMGFKKYSPPRDIPEEIKETIKELKNRSVDQRSFLEATYNFVQERWQAERLKTISHFPLIFRTNIAEIWQRPGYAHCNTINFILFTLLVNSRYFTEDDIRIKHIFFNMVIHQYLRVRVGGEWLDVDPSTKYLRLPIGQHSRWFG